MSDKTNTIALVVFWSILLLSISFLLGVKSGKHSADHWWEARTIHSFVVYKDGKLDRIEPMKEKMVINPNEDWKAKEAIPMAPAGIGKPQAPSVVAPNTWKYSDSVDWEDSPEWKAHQKRLREANPLKLGKPSAKRHRTTHQECESETQREYKSMEGWATGDPAITLGDGTFDAGTQELWSKQPCGWSDNANPPNIRPRYVYSQKGIEREITEQEFNKKELGKRKPAP